MLFTNTCIHKGKLGFIYDTAITYPARQFEL